MKGIDMTKWLLIMGVLFSASVSYANRFDYLKHVDIRDIAKYDNRDVHFRGTSNKIMEAFEGFPGLFVGEIADDLIIPNMATQVRYYREGAIGPDGHYSKNDSGADVFVSTNKNEHTRKNVILSVDYEKVVDVTGEDKVFDADLLLFVHDDFYGYYFRRLQVRVDWFKNAQGSILDVVQVTKFHQDIHLNETRFNVKASILDRKMILEDPYNMITKVFPLTVGALDIRTEVGMDGQVHSMTFLVPNRLRNSNNRYSEYEPFENAELKKASSWHAINNTRARNFPAYFRGRPFIAIIDKNLGDNAGGYREIGFHYQINRDRLIRGFESHGCVRMADKDLYQLDAILNEGPHETIPTKVVYDLPQYKTLDNPMPKVNSNYNVVAYSKMDPSTKVVRCKSGSTYSVRHYGGGYHTVSDGDCLTLVQRRNQSATSVVNYMLGFNNEFPSAHVTRLAHIPYAQEAEEQRAIYAQQQQQWQQQQQQEQIYRQQQYRPPEVIYQQQPVRRKATLFDMIFGR